MNTTSKVDHLAVPIDFLAYKKNQLAQTSFELRNSRSRIVGSAVAPHWLGWKGECKHYEVHTSLYKGLWLVFVNV